MSQPMPERIYRVEFACGVRAELRVSPSAFDVRWTPELPTHLKGPARREFVSAYRAWRSECLEDFHRHTGLRVAVVDWPPRAGT